MGEMKVAARETSRPEDFALVVAGGGPAGIAAAIAAARHGLKTLLIERYGFLGGMATAGLVNPFMYTEGAGGLYQELLARLSRWGAREDRTFDAEVLKLLLDEWLAEEGVEVSLHSLLIDAVREEGRVTQVEVAGKAERLTLRAPFYVDATGDGDLAALAGATMEVGRREDGLCQPMTLNFQMGGVEEAELPPREEFSPRSREKFNVLYREAKARGRLHNPRGDLLWFRTVRPGEVHFNTTRVIGLNPLSTADLTRAEQEARRQVAELVQWLREEVPGFARAYLLKMATQIGVRESRRLVGSYLLTEEDVLGRRKFPDAIGRCSYPIDIHSPTGEGTRLSHLPPGEWYEIPYRCLLTPEVENLAVAGRCLSATHEAQASLRIMPTCMVTGQAAGTAVALAARRGCRLAEVPVAELQALLRADGAML